MRPPVISPVTPPTTPSTPSSRALSRGRALRRLDLAAGLLAGYGLLVALPAAVWAAEGVSAAAGVALASSLAFAVLPWWARRGPSPRHAAHALLVLLAATVVAWALLTGSFAPPAAWLVALPLASSVLLGPRATPAWTLASVALLAGLAWLQDLETPEATLAQGGLAVFVGVLATRFQRDQHSASRQAQASLEHLASTQQERVREGTLAAVGELAGGAAHELNNALCGVLPAAQMIADEIDRAADSPTDLHRDVALVRARQRLELVQHSAERAAEIVSALMWFAGSTERAVQGTDLTEITRSSLTLCREVVTREGAALEVALPPALPCRGVPQDLAQVVLNVLDNARRASGPGYRIRVSGRQRGGRVELEIADEGAGMTTGVKERAFEPFFTTRGLGEGRGLGLAVAYGIARQHGGDLGIDTEPGRGTTVTLSLPAQPAQDAV